MLDFGLNGKSQNHQEIGRALNISRDMARLWRNRWLELSGKPLSVVERLTDHPCQLKGMGSQIC
ncbi:MAG: hypothetical protein KA717_16400 [Woronichinia naegeliana WA131]|uniref:Helix-turn-helix domain-containing protein n=1 Tax=Woronichinia naegeliana WA131 TaxID=2824559 RepID=A0A977L1U4_9CYAN|nr:MAG: hypothetical protein KA717_16400 [Woronichinia naegeliana WA131]